MHNLLKVSGFKTGDSLERLLIVGPAKSHKLSLKPNRNFSSHVILIMTEKSRSNSAVKYAKCLSVKNRPIYN